MTTTHMLGTFINKEHLAFDLCPQNGGDNQTFLHIMWLFCALRRMRLMLLLSKEMVDCTVGLESKVLKLTCSVWIKNM